MPATIKKPRLKSWIDEEPSVVESGLERGVRKVAKTASDWFGDLPGAGEMSVGPTVSPLISIFKDKAAREAAGKLFDTRVGKLAKDMADRGYDQASKHFEYAGKLFAEKYPRIAAHTALRPKLQENKGYYAAVSDGYAGKKKRVPMKFARKAAGQYQDKYQGLDAAIEDMFHEGTHVAQTLGNKDIDELYGTATKHLADPDDWLSGVNAYTNNPFEQTARASGARAVERNRRKLGGYQEKATNNKPTGYGDLKMSKPKNAIEILNQQVGPGTTDSPEKEAIIKILKRRGQYIDY